MRFVAKIGQLDALQLSLKLRELRQQSEILVAILTPRDLIPNRHFAHASAGRNLIPGIEHRFSRRLGNVHCAFNHRDTRSLDAGVHGEDRARDCNASIRRLHIKMSTMLFGRGNNNVSAAQVDRHPVREKVIEA